MPVIESVEPPRQWQLRPEAGGRLARLLLRPLAFGLGRPVARFICCFVALYFMIRRAPERVASRAYLARVLGRRAGWRDVYRHFLCFSRVVLDRLYLMTDQISRFDVQIFGREQVAAAHEQGRGALLLSAHLGSFDVLRVMSLRNPNVSTRILLDVGQNAALSELLNELNPNLASTILDARRPGPALVLEMQQALATNAIVSTLADRLRPGNPVIVADFLGAPAPFPASPWLLASALHVPVVLAFGLYRGGKRYELHFERFDFELPRDRSARGAALAAVVQRFADRLAHFARLAPYNWFNLYDFWDAPLGTNHPPVRTAAGEHGRTGPQP